MASQPKTPLKVVESGSNFHRKPNLYQGTKLHWSGPLESCIRNFISGVWGWSGPPLMGVMSSISQCGHSEALN